MVISTHAKGVLITAAGVLAISPDGLLIRLISADTLTIAFWRSLFYSFGMLVLLSLYYRKRIIDAMFGIGLPGLALAVLYFIVNLGFIYSINHTAVANTLFLLSTTPFWAALIAWIVFKERVQTRTWSAIFFAGIGIIIICSGESIMPNAHLGNLAGLIAACALATSFTVVSRNRKRDLLPALILGGFMTALVLEPFVAPSTISDRDLGYLFLMGFIILPLAGSLMYIGPKYISAPEVSLLMLLESICGPLWVWCFLDEHPGNLVVLGGAMVLLTLMLHAWISMRGSSTQIDRSPSGSETV